MRLRRVWFDCWVFILQYYLPDFPTFARFVTALCKLCFLTAVYHCYYSYCFLSYNQTLFAQCSCNIPIEAGLDRSHSCILCSIINSLAFVQRFCDSGVKTNSPRSNRGFLSAFLSVTPGITGVFFKCWKKLYKRSFLKIFNLECHLFRSRLLETAKLQPPYPLFAMTGP